MGQLSGRVAMITGASRGQGEAGARLFHAEGAKVIIADILDAEGEALAKELGENAVYKHLDVTKEEDWQTAVAFIDERFGKLDALVNNAGILRIAPLFDTGLEEYRTTIDVNHVSCFLGMKIAGQAIVKAGGGTIVNISSLGGLMGIAGGTAYVASKFAVTGMSKTAAIELGPLGVRVNVVHPGSIDTPMVRSGEFEDLDPEESASNLPLGRIGTPGDIAKLVLFLTSDASAFCTGASFTADGGMMAGVVPGEK
jgi:3alpha(or 20beta)-hydroxysteroid dehydrogenase